MDKIEGLLAAPITPVDRYDRINPDIIEDYANFLKRNGVVGVFVNGSTGEGLSFTVEERMTVAEKWLDCKPENFIVIINIGHPSIKIARKLAEHAEKYGADAVGTLPPLYFKPTCPEDLVEHLAREAEAAPNTPFFYYHIPVITGVNFPMRKLVELADRRIGNFAGIKYTYMDLADYAECVRFGGGKYNILYGRDEMLLSALLFGARAAIGSTYNWCSNLSNKIIGLFGEGKDKEAFELQMLANSMILKLLDSGKFLGYIKAIMARQGIDGGRVRPPLVMPTPEEVEKIYQFFEKIGILRYFSE